MTKGNADSNATSADDDMDDNGDPELGQHLHCGPRADYISDFRPTPSVQSHAAEECIMFFLESAKKQ